jgi:hypothetical protein
MGKKSSDVEAVDPLEVASTDAAFNRIDQITPTGNLTFSDRPGGPFGANNVATLTLPPEIQRLFESQIGSDQALLNLALGRQQGFEQGLPDLIQGLETESGDVRDIFFDEGSKLLNRQFDLDEAKLRGSLANRGLTGAGTNELGEAPVSELGLFNQEKNRAFERLAGESVQRGIGTQLSEANIRQSNRATQFNELAALLGLQQVAQPGLNNFFTPSRADTGAGFAMQNQANMANAQNDAMITSGILEGLFGLGGAFIGRP